MDIGRQILGDIETIVSRRQGDASQEWWGERFTANCVATDFQRSPDLLTGDINLDNLRGVLECDIHPGAVGRGDDSIRFVFHCNAAGDFAGRSVCQDDLIVTVDRDGDVGRLTQKSDPFRVMSDCDLVHNLFRLQVDD